MTREADVDRRVRERFRDESGQVALDAPDAAEQRLRSLLAAESPLLTADQLAVRARHLAEDLVGLGPLHRLLERPGVTDVLVNGPGEVWVERSGRLERGGTALDRSDIDRAIERLVTPLGLRADRSSPIVDARLADGTRVTVVLDPLAVDGPLLALRRHGAEPMPLETFGDASVVNLLRDCVESRHNIGIYGATGAGKTTLVNALVSEVRSDERIVTIEDVAELRLGGHHVVRLESRPGSADGVGRAGVRDLVRAALRLRPDRIVLGEVRGAEALDMVWALSTGHDGSVATWHASSAVDALGRLATLCALSGEGIPHAALVAQIHAAFDVLVGVARLPDRSRAVTAVHRVHDDGTVHRLAGP